MFRGHLVRACGVVAITPTMKSTNGWTIRDVDSSMMKFMRCVRSMIENYTLIKPCNQAAYFGTFMTQFKLLFLDLNFIGIWDVSSVIPKFVN